MKACEHLLKHRPANPAGAHRRANERGVWRNNHV
ncbi:hypothetical protein SAMN05414139_04317 [Burkholderia sp. D7]|nr:hypothetical protein SAMN05414139_04317 [Burkholderia sp. D7]